MRLNSRYRFIPQLVLSSWMLLAFSTKAFAESEQNRPTQKDNNGFFDKGFVNQNLFPELSGSKSASSAAPSAKSPSAITSPSRQNPGFDVQKYELPTEPTPPTNPVPPSLPEANPENTSGAPVEMPRGEPQQDASKTMKHAASVIQQLRQMQEDGRLPPPAAEPGFFRRRDQAAGKRATGAQPTGGQVDGPLNSPPDTSSGGSFDHGSLDALRESIRREQEVDSSEVSREVTKTVFDRTDSSGAAASLSLIVAGKPQSELIRHIRAAASVKRTHNVRLDAIIIVGEIEEGTFQVISDPQKKLQLTIGEFEDSYALQRQGVQLSPASRALYDAGLLNSSFESFDEDATRLGIDQVPTWIVRTPGEEHIFPGNYEPTSLFNGRGEFIGQRVGEARYAEAKQSFLTTIIPHESVGAKPLPRRSNAKVYGLVIRPATPQQMSSKAKPGSGPDIVEFPKLASCGVSRVRRQPIHQLPLFFPDNLLFFLPTDGRAPMPEVAEQQKLTLVPYREGAYDRARLKEKEELQIWAGVLGVSCLPTRFLFVVDQGRPYMEWREGDRAWEAPLS